MQTRRLANTDVSVIGLGCMNLSHAYGPPVASERGVKLIERALDLGVTHFDTASLYGAGRNEELVGRALKPHRNRIFLASKCGMTFVDGKRLIDGRPDTLKRNCRDSLRRLGVEMIDLYYLHRLDKSVPIEDSVGALADLVKAGLIGAIGLSEISTSTLRRAQSEHPISAVQSEYSVFTRNAEYGMLDACRELGAAYVAFSPLSRGFLTDEPPTTLAEGDIRRTMPRFNPPFAQINFEHARQFHALAKAHDLRPAALALAWLVDRAPHVLPIPGTTSLAHLQENVDAASITISADLRARIDALLSADTDAVLGPRYAPAMQADIDTESSPVGDR